MRKVKRDLGIFLVISALSLAMVLMLVWMNHASRVHASSIGNGGGGGGGGAQPGTTVQTTFSATPTFTCPSSTQGTVVNFILSTSLTTNITNGTLANCTAGSLLNFRFTQDGTGGRTVTLNFLTDPPTVNPAPFISTKCSYFSDPFGNIYLTGGGCVSDASYGWGTMQGGPAGINPPATSCFSWFDITDFNAHWKCNNGSGVGTYAAVFPQSRVPNQFVTGILATGQITTAAIAQADLPATSTQTIGPTSTLVVPVTALAGNTCDAAPTTVTITGANPATDTWTSTATADPTGTTGYGGGTNGGLTLWLYLTANTVNLKRCNQTANSITPGPLSLLVKVLR